MSTVSRKLAQWSNFTLGYEGISTTTFRILWPTRVKSGAEDFHILSVASYEISENQCPESQMLPKCVNEVLFIYSTFFGPVSIKLDRGDVQNNLVSNFLMKRSIVKTMLYLEG